MADDKVVKHMINARGIFLSIEEELYDLFVNISEVTCRADAIQLQHHSHALVWELEVYGLITTRYAFDLRGLFQFAFERRVHEFAFL